MNSVISLFLENRSVSEEPDRERGTPFFMSIANELSSEVAEAMLARRQDESSQSVRDLAGVVKEVHSTLRRLTAQSRRRKARPRDAAVISHEAAGAASAASSE